MRNLGPASAAMLVKAGIRSTDEFRSLGALECYWRVKQTNTKVSLNLLWALVGAIENCHWTKIDADTRSALLIALDARADLEARVRRGG